MANCLAAAAVALSCGVDLQAIARGIESVESLPSRMERIDCGQGFPVYVDAASTPDALIASLRAARQVAHGRVICVLGDDQQKTTMQIDRMNSVARRLADLTIVTGEQSQEMCEWNSAEMEDSSLQVVSDRGEAIAWAVSMAESGDVVVIAGSQPPGHAGFGVKAGMDDAEIARQLLYARHEAASRRLGKRGRSGRAVGALSIDACQENPAAAAYRPGSQRPAG